MPEQYVRPWSERIDTFSPPAITYPGRVSGQGASGAVNVLPSPGVWRFSVTLAGDYSPSHQGLADRLQGLESFSFDLSLLNLWRIPSERPATGQSLRTDSIELVTSMTDVELDQFFMYGGKLYRVAETLSDRMRAIPRPDTLPGALGNLTLPGAVDVLMPRAPAPAVRRGRYEAPITIGLQTLP